MTRSSRRASAVCGAAETADLELLGPAVEEERQHLRALQQGRDLDELLLAVGAAALGAHAVERRRDRRGVIAVRAAAGGDRAHVDAELAARRAHDLQQPLGAGQAGWPGRKAHLTR